ILLLPIYYAVKNVLTELHRVGKWKIGWERFFQVSFTELMIGLMLLVGEGKEPTSISGWIMAYLLYLLATSIFVSISKDVQI
ncbi:MAG: hypothetical protein U9N81_14475, partial [Bacillota bacterium]|nr:hypothetical protein [Bacillota bacterium]